MEITIVDACMEDDRCRVTVAIPSKGPKGQIEFTERHFSLPAEIALASADEQRLAVREAVCSATEKAAPALKILGETLTV